MPVLCQSAEYCSVESLPAWVPLFAGMTGTKIIHFFPGPRVRGVQGPWRSRKARMPPDQPRVDQALILISTHARHRRPRQKAAAQATPQCVVSALLPPLLRLTSVLAGRSLALHAATTSWGRRGGGSPTCGVCRQNQLRWGWRMRAAVTTRCACGQVRQARAAGPDPALPKPYCPTKTNNVQAATRCRNRRFDKHEHSAP